MDSLSLGPVPCNEDCQQAGTPGYEPSEALRECRRYVSLLREKFGDEPKGAALRVTSNPHDFGSYYDVEVFYDPSSKEAVEYAFKMEKEAPERWGE